MSTGEQLPLAFPPRARDLHATFSEGPSNRTARHALDRWRHWPSAAMALIGPPACGKTHLAAMWATVHGGALIAPDVWSTNPDAVVDTHLGCPVALEDADTPKVQTSHALYTLLNAAREGRLAGVLITARTRPTDWIKDHTNASLDLQSRLANLPTLEVTDPNDEELTQLIEKLFADRGVNIPSAVVLYLVRRMERSHAAAVDVVDALDKRALAHNAKITTRLAATLFDPEDNEKAE